MNINKKRNSSENNKSNYSYQLKQQCQENFIYNMFSSIKIDKLEKKKKLKSLLTSNIIHYKNSKVQNKKSNIKKNLESSINYSKNNFCGSFLVPDYTYVTGTKILSDLKSKGAEKTVKRHFSKDIPKADFIKNFKCYSFTRNKTAAIKSKYFNLVNSNITRINKMTSFKNNSGTHFDHRLRSSDKYNKSFNYFFSGINLKKNKAKNNYFNYNNNKDKVSKNSGNNIYNNIFIKSFYASSLNNSKSILSSSTSCSSKTLYYSKKN